MPSPGHQHRAALEETMPSIQGYTTPQTGTLRCRLDEQLEPEHILTKPGEGGGEEYNLDAEKVSVMANEVFGFNGWSSAIRDVQVDFVDENHNTGQITLGLSVTVRVILRDGTFHDGIGYGCVEDCNGKATAFERAKKNAAADALRRAFRHFGGPPGSYSHDKEYPPMITEAKITPEEARTDAPAERSSAIESARSQPDVSNRTELEDEFGGDPFDEVYFSEGHPDEALLDSVPVMKAAADVSEMRLNDQPPHTVLST